MFQSKGNVEKRTFVVENQGKMEVGEDGWVVIRRQRSSVGSARAAKTTERSGPKRQKAKHCHGGTGPDAPHKD